MIRRMTKSRFQEELLCIMDHKHHWAWPAFADGAVTIDQLARHFQQEYGVYVRDFPIFLAHIYGQNPPAPVRRMLAENIYEEDTGGLSLGKSHPELFLTMMAGLGLSAHDFENVRLLPAGRRYRAWLDRASKNRDWVIGAAVLTVFVEGSVKDRAEIAHPSKPKTREEIEAIVQRHSLVKHHGLSPDSMDLIRAHQMVESGHRHDAYIMVVNYATTQTQQQAVLRCLKKCLTLWQAYRDAVAKACRLKKP
jgi:pyrroloquinoline quinone (PQQ) biosynthesis protein C